MKFLEKLHLLFRTLNMNDDENKAKVCGISTNFIRKMIDLFFIIIDQKGSTNIPLNKTYYLNEIVKITLLYGPMHFPSGDYPPYSDTKCEIFETNINKAFRCIHGYTNHFEKYVLITWVSINSWEMLLYEFTQALDINPRTRTIVCNTYELINVSGDILNANENVEYEYDYGFIRSFFKNPLLL